MAPSQSNVAEQLTEIGKKLKPTLARDVLIRTLKQLSGLLGGLAHGETSLEPVSLPLVNQAFLQHSNKEVQLLVAVCIGYVFKGSAPECPYDNSTLQEVFPVMIEALRHLGDIANPAAQKQAVELLHTLAKYKICLLLLDLDEGDDGDGGLLPELFRSLLTFAVNEQNQYSVGPDVLEVMAVLLDEFDDPQSVEEASDGTALAITTPLLDEILRPLMPPQKDDNPAAYELAKQLLHRCESKLQPYIQKFLMEVIDNGRVDGSDLQGDHRDFIFEVYVAWPECMLSVLPRMTDELQVNIADTRIKACDLIGRLLLVPGSTVATEYRSLFAEFLRRFKDKLIGIRLNMINWSQSFLLVCEDEAVTKRVEESVHALVLDFEDKVRLAASGMLCEVAALNPSVVPMEHLQSVAQRVRDKKVVVRREALKQLALLYKSQFKDETHHHHHQHQLHHTNSAGGGKSPGGLRGSGEDLAWIPGKMLWCCADPDLRHHALEAIVEEDLFPARLSPQDCIEQWMLAYDRMNAREQSFLAFLLRKKHLFQQELAGYLQLRSELRGLQTAKGKTNQEAVDQLAARCASKCKALAQHFPDRVRAEESMEKVHAVVDQKVFKGLEKLVNLDTPVAEVRAARDDVLARLGGKSPACEIAHALLMKASMSAISKQHVKAGLALIQKIAMDKKGAPPKAHGKILLEAGLKLMHAIGAEFPLLFSDSLPILQDLLKECKTEMVTNGVSRILASVSPGLTAPSESQTCMAPVLASLCLTGTREQAKHAIRALVALTGDECAGSAKKGSAPGGKKAHQGDVTNVLVDMYEKSVANLLNHRPEANEKDMLVTMQTLGEIAKLKPRIFLTYSKKVTDFVIGLLPNKNSKSNAKKPPKNAKTGSAQLHAQALKLLVKSCLSDTGEVDMTAKLQTNAKVALDQLQMVMRLEKVADVQALLAAGKGMVKLATKHEGLITPQLLFLIGGLLRHVDPSVRVGMLTCLKKVLVARKVSHKFAALLALSATDPVKEHQALAMSTLKQVVKVYRARTQEALAKQAAASADSLDAKSRNKVMIQMPEYIFTYLISILAHHPNFPKGLDSPTPPKPSTLDPFQEALHFLLQALTADSAPALPFVCKILRYMKSTEDPMDATCTHNIYVLSDMALIMVTEVSAANGWSIGTFPTSIPLPAAYFQVRHAVASKEVTSPNGLPKRRGDGCYLPPNFLLNVKGLAPKSRSQAAAPASISDVAEEATSLKEEPGQAAGAGHATPRTGNMEICDVETAAKKQKHDAAASAARMDTPASPRYDDVEAGGGEWDEPEAPEPVPTASPASRKGKKQAQACVDSARESPAQPCYKTPVTTSSTPAAGVASVPLPAPRTTPASTPVGFTPRDDIINNNNNHNQMTAASVARVTPETGAVRVKMPAMHLPMLPSEVALASGALDLVGPASGGARRKTAHKTKRAATESAAARGRKRKQVDGDADEVDVQLASPEKTNPRKKPARLPKSHTPASEDIAAVPSKGKAAASKPKTAKGKVAAGRKRALEEESDSEPEPEEEEQQLKRAIVGRGKIQKTDITSTPSAAAKPTRGKLFNTPDAASPLSKGTPISANKRTVVAAARPTRTTRLSPEVETIPEPKVKAAQSAKSLKSPELSQSTPTPRGRAASTMAKPAAEKGRNSPASRREPLRRSGRGSQSSPEKSPANAISKSSKVKAAQELPRTHRMTRRR